MKMERIIEKIEEILKNINDYEEVEYIEESNVEEFNKIIDKIINEENKNTKDDLILLLCRKFKINGPISCEIEENKWLQRFKIKEFAVTYYPPYKEWDGEAYEIKEGKFTQNGINERTTVLFDSLEEAKEYVASQEEWEVWKTWVETGSYDSDGEPEWEPSYYLRSTFSPMGNVSYREDTCIGTFPSKERAYKRAKKLAKGGYVQVDV